MEGFMNYDRLGAPIAVARLDSQRAYGNLPTLLQHLIDEKRIQNWYEIVEKIDFLYEQVDIILTKLNQETSFGNEAQARIQQGKWLLLQPDCRQPISIDPLTHREGEDYDCCTKWPLLAAVMRWFHDRLNISYYKMIVVGMDATTKQLATDLSRVLRKEITAPGLMEGRVGDFYGGFGFYFVRNYLQERHPAKHRDDPMQGFFVGNYQATPAPNGLENRLHICDSESLKSKYPGSVLVNIAQLKLSQEEEVCNTQGNLGTKDLIQDLLKQDMMVVHICDAIHIMNINERRQNGGITVLEGLLMASLDCVALDYFAARYCFNMFFMQRGMELARQYGLKTEFLQQVPMVRQVNAQMVTFLGVDSPLLRCTSFEYATRRKIGQMEYYVIGQDQRTNCALASVRGHLGKLEEGKFVELVTSTLYYHERALLHHLQATMLSYLNCCDQINAHNRWKESLASSLVEEAKHYIEAPKKRIQLRMEERYSSLQEQFQTYSRLLRYSRKDWNEEGLEDTKEMVFLGGLKTAYELSRKTTLELDSYDSTLSFGLSRWPSFEMAAQCYLTRLIYGNETKEELNSMYGCVQQYANSIGENTQYWLHVPKGYGQLKGEYIKGVIEDEELNRLWKVEFYFSW